jgi:hypothetical protein
MPGDGLSVTITTKSAMAKAKKPAKKAAKKSAKKGK